MALLGLALLLILIAMAWALTSPSRRGYGDGLPLRHRARRS
jgi:hypothetical protein